MEESKGTLCKKICSREEKYTTECKHSDEKWQLIAIEKKKKDKAER